MESKKGFPSRVRYEEMIQSKTKIYFDSNELEEIADYYEEVEDFAKALEVAEYGLSLHSSHTALLLKKIRFMIYLDQTAEAAELLNTLTVEGEEVDIIQIELKFASGETENALYLLKEKIFSPDIDEEPFFDYMEILWSHISIDKILMLLKELIALHPNHIYGLKEMGYLYQKSESIDLAIKVYNKILEINSSREDVWIELINCHMIMSDIKMALKVSEKAVKANPSSDILKVTQSALLIQTGNTKRALKILKELKPSNILSEKEIEIHKATCYNYMDRIDKAQEVLQKLSEKYPTDDEIYHRIALNYWDMGNTPMAKEVLEKAMEYACEENPEYYELLLEIYLLDDNWEKAEECLLILRKYNPTSTSILQDLGKVCYFQKKYEEGVSYFKKVLSFDPKEPKAMLFLINCYNQLGEAEMASRVSKELASSLEMTANIADEVDTEFFVTLLHAAETALQIDSPDDEDETL